MIEVNIGLWSLTTVDPNLFQSAKESLIGKDEVFKILNDDLLPSLFQ